MTTEPTTADTETGVDMKAFARFSAPQITSTIAVLQRLLALREEENSLLRGQSNHVTVVSPPPPPTRPAANLLAMEEDRRGEMRDPRPGTVRADIYTVLEPVEMMRFANVVAAVAELRGVPSDERLKANVGKVLRNPFDPRIRRLGRGEFTLRSGRPDADRNEENLISLAS